MKTRTALSGTHGERFHDQFCLFKIQRQQIIEISASISKRLMALGNLPISESRAYLIYTRLDQISGDISYLIELFSNHNTVIRFLREDAKKFSTKFKDEVTRDFLVDILDQHEKMAWTLLANIEPELTGNEHKDFAYILTA